MISRRRFLARLAALPAMGSLSGIATDPSQSAYRKPFRIYMIRWRGATDVDKGFQDYLIARKIPADFIIREADQSMSKLAEFVREIKTIKPDLIYTWGTSATLGVVGPYDAGNSDEFVTDTPVVFALVASPVGAKIVPSISHNRNVTGVLHLPGSQAQMEAIRAYRPFKRLGTLYNPREPNSVITTQELRALAIRDGFTLIERTVDVDPQGRPVSARITDKLDEIKKQGAEWLFIGPDSYLFTQITTIGPYCLAIGLPTFATTESVIDAPASILAGLFSNYYSIGQLTGVKAEQILMKGTAPRNILIETPKEFILVVRMSVARQLKLLPPLSMFNYADIRQ